jgi:hypothetical protein
VGRAAFLVALLLATAGCRTAATRLALSADDPRPWALVRGWQEHAAQRHALRGSARLAVDGEQLSVRARQILVVERPSRLRVEVQGLLSQTLAVLVTDGPRYQLFRAEDRSFETGEVHPGLLWQVASLDLEPEDAIDLVLGAPRLAPDLVPQRAFQTGAGEIAVELADAGGALRERRSFDGEGRLRRVERFAGADVVWSAEFDAYRSVAGVPLAHAIRLEAVKPATRAELELTGVELNPELPADMFRLQPAVGTGGSEAEGG